MTIKENSLDIKKLVELASKNHFPIKSLKISESIIWADTNKSKGVTKTSTLMLWAAVLFVNYFLTTSSYVLVLVRSIALYSNLFE